MFKDTFLVAHKRKDQSPRILDLESIRASALERILFTHKDKQAKAKQLCKQHGCGNDLNVKRKLL
jgi:hypothetical protein